MPYRIQLRSDLGLAVITWSGEITQRDVENALIEVPRTEGFRAGLNLFADWRGCTSAIGWWQIRHIAAFSRQRERAWGRSKWAIVVSSDLVYGLARIYVALASQGKVKSQVFRDAEAALLWLKTGSDASAVLGELAVTIAATEAPAVATRKSAN